MSETINPATNAQLGMANNKAKGVSMGMSAETVKAFSILFSAGAFIIGFLAVLFGLVYVLLDAKIDPIDKRITKIEIRMDKIEMKVDKIEKRMDNLEAGQAEIKQMLIDLKNNFQNPIKRAK